MTYGTRLQTAIDHRSEETGRKVTRKEVAGVAGCSPQNIGMIINSVKGAGQHLSPVSHSAVARYLCVNPDWLLTGQGSLAPFEKQAAHGLSDSAKDIGALFDMIPEGDLVARLTALSAATTAIMQVLTAMKK